MASVNKIILMGRLGRDPEFRSVGDKEVASMSLATDEQWKDKNGERQKKTQWHRLSCWISIPFIKEYLHAGDSVYVEGKMEYREWVDKEGAKKSTPEVNVTEIKAISTGDRDQQSNSRPASNNRNNNSRSAARPAQQQRSRQEVSDDDIPF